MMVALFDIFFQAHNIGQLRYFSTVDLLNLIILFISINISCKNISYINKSLKFLENLITYSHSIVRGN